MSHPTIPDWQLRIANNADRIQLTLGLISFYAGTYGLLSLQPAASLTFLLGGWLLGGRTAAHALLTHPQNLLAHYYHILRHTQRVHIIEHPDDTDRVSIMQPRLRPVLSWREVRRTRNPFNQGDEA